MKLVTFPSNHPQLATSMRNTYRMQMENLYREYLGHTLFYVSKSIHRETAKLFYQTATFTITPFFRSYGLDVPLGFACKEIIHLCLNEGELVRLLVGRQATFVFPKVNYPAASSIDAIQFLPFPTLKHLEIHCNFTSQYLMDPDSDRAQRLTAFIDFRKSFALEVHCSVGTLDRMYETPPRPQMIAILTRGSPNVTYGWQVSRIPPWEQHVRESLHLDGGAEMIVSMEGWNPGTGWQYARINAQARQRLFSIVEPDRVELFETAWNDYSWMRTTA